MGEIRDCERLRRATEKERERERRILEIVGQETVRETGKEEKRKEER